MNWLETAVSGVDTPWANRIKLTIDGSKVEGDLTDFPVLVHLGSSVGTNNRDVSDVFEKLTASGTLFYDTCSGTISDRWTDNSNGNSFIDYNLNKMRLYIDNGDSTEGSNALTKGSWLTSGKYLIEFDWWPVPGSLWYDDDNTDAKHIISIVGLEPSYNDNDWAYNTCNSTYRLELRLRSTKSNLIMINETGGAGTLLNESFSYGTYHKVSWIIDFNNLKTSLYMDNNRIGSEVDISSGVVNGIGSEYRMNFHWHTYYNTAAQIYDNITIRDIEEVYKIAITGPDGTTQQYVEIEDWDSVNQEAWLWTKVPTISSGTNQYMYLYYDIDMPDNDSYVGDTNSSPAQSVWDNDFKLVCHLNSSLLDSTVNYNNGTNAGANDVVGLIGDAKSFPNSSDKITFTTTNFSSTNTYTVESLAKPTAETAVTLWEGSNSLSAPSMEGSSNDLKYYVGGSTFINTGILTIGEWKYLVAKYDKANTRQALWIDNSEVGYNSVDVSDIFGSSFYLGNRNGSTRNYGGSVDELRISSSARSDAWIKATYYSNFDNLINFGAPQASPTFGYTGYTKVEGVAASRHVGLYRRSTMALVDEAYSNSSNGYFVLYTPYNDYHFVVILPELTDGYNLLAYDKIHPEN